MAPEFFTKKIENEEEKGDHELNYDEKVDVYALAVILY